MTAAAKMFHKATNAPEASKPAPDQGDKPVARDSRSASRRMWITRKKMAKARAIISGQLGEMG